MAPNIDDVSSMSTWKGDEFCRFSQVFTAEGLCFAFNALKFHEIYTNE